MPQIQVDRAHSIPRRHPGKFPKSLADPTLERNLTMIHSMYPEVNLDQLLHLLKVQGKEFTSENLIDAAYDLALDSQGESCSSTDSEPPHRQQLRTSLVGDSEDDMKPSSKEERKKAVEQAKQRLKKDIEALKIECYYCHKRKATILLLPCAHLACCEYCLIDVRRCAVPRCKKVVRGTKEVYFV